VSAIHAGATVSRVDAVAGGHPAGVQGV